MRIARIAHPDGVAFVAVEQGENDELVAAEIAEHPFGVPRFTGRRWPLADARLLAPILPTKIVCIGKNYADHIKEMGGDTPPADPVIFMKPNTSVIGPNAEIKLPPSSAE
ncbi:MAG: fumarylacetoacetate hydrolase family protein, partial [Sciscionella sp.]